MFNKVKNMDIGMFVVVEDCETGETGKYSNIKLSNFQILTNWMISLKLQKIGTLP